MITIIQYQTHLILNSKYSFIIKLLIIFTVYVLFYMDNTNDIASCAPTKKHLIDKVESLKAENTNLKTELNRFRMSSGMDLYQNIGEETLESLKQKIEIFRTKHEAGFLTLEEQERFSAVTHTGATRSDFNLGPEFFNQTKYEDVTNDYIYPHATEHFCIDRKFIDDTGKEIFDLHKNYRWHKAYMYEHTRFNESNSWFFYDYTERYKEVVYPANHPDNNFDPTHKRLRKLVEREFYEKQLPDKIEENCNIS